MIAHSFFFHVVKLHLPNSAGFLTRAFHFIRKDLQIHELTVVKYRIACFEITVCCEYFNLVIFSCIFFKIEVTSICSSYCTLIDLKRLIVKESSSNFTTPNQSRYGLCTAWLCNYLVIFTHRRMYKQRHFRQANLQSDPILQDERFTNKFKFSVGEVLYKKN